MTTKQIIVFGILICLLTVTAYYAGYSHGYNQGKEDWFSIGEMAGRTNEIADRLHNDYHLPPVLNTTVSNYTEFNYTYAGFNYNWSGYLYENTTMSEVAQ